MTADEAIALLHQILNTAEPKVQLNDTQLKVFRLIWSEAPYGAIAKATGYDYDYVKQVSSKLWQLLSKVLNQPVSRRNLQTVFQQCAQSYAQSLAPEPLALQAVQSQPVLSQLAPPQAVLHNLPVANYSSLVGREAETARLLNFFSFQHPAHCISIEGLGGMGKTTLALSIAYRFLQSPGAFNAIIFTSAQSQRLTAAGVLPRLQPDCNLRDIFRAIAHTLHCPDLLLQPFAAQLAQIQLQLSHQRTLLIIDNLETIEDWQSILAFLYDLPMTVKVLLTSRQQTPFPSITLEPLSEPESVYLIQNQLAIKGIDLHQARLHQLQQQTSGIPAAIVYAVGLVASGYPLAASAVARGDYAHFYFESSLRALKPSAAYDLFMAFALFPDSAVPDAIAAVAAVMEPQAMIQGLATLQQLSLIVQQNGRYAMLPLTREYAIAALSAEPEFQALAHNRRVQWYLTFAELHGGKDWRDWQNYSSLEQEWNTLQAVVEWCIADDRYLEVCQFWQKIRCYSHAQGYRSDRLTCWATRLDWTDWLIQAAEQRHDWTIAAEVLFDRAWTLTLLGQAHHLEAAEPLFVKAWSYCRDADLAFQIDLAIHVAVWQIQRQQFPEALCWLKDVETLLNAVSSLETTADHTADPTANQRLWIQWHYYHGEIDYKMADYNQAHIHFSQALEQAQALDWQRVIFLIKDWLAHIALKAGDLPRARLLLEEGLQIAQAQDDSCRIAFCMRSLAQLEQAQGNQPLARHWADHAKQQFEQLGMIVEARETVELLQGLH